MTRPKLKIIAATHRPVVDIYAAWREEVAAIDWAATHVRGDRGQPVELPDRPRWAGFRK